MRVVNNSSPNVCIDLGGNFHLLVERVGMQIVQLKIAESENSSQALLLSSLINMLCRSTFTISCESCAVRSMI